MAMASGRQAGCLKRCRMWLALGIWAGLGCTPGFAQTTVLVGAGSTIPVALFAKWGREYSQRNPLARMRYLPVGTTEGIDQISHGTGDFGVGESPLTDKQRREGSLIELPLLLIAVVPIYNLPGGNQELRLSGEVLAEIFLGEVKTWNAPSIVRLNPDMALPNLPIKVIHRAAGRGSNFVFTSFLAKASPRFQAQIGTTASPNWRTGRGVEYSSDVADAVRDEPGSIGYVELRYAMERHLPQAAVLNLSGRFVKASAETITAACTAVEQQRWNNFSASLTNAPGPDSYPITSFSWLYLPGANLRHAPALADLLNWMFTDGQRYVRDEGYFELPQPLLAAVRSRFESLR